MRNIVISLGRKENLAAVTKTVSTSWEKFAEFLMREPPVTDDKASVGWYCGAEFDPEYRDSDNFVARHVLTFDYDEIDPWDLDEIQNTYDDLEHIIYTTASHTPEKPRVRVVFPLSRPAKLDEFCAITRKVAARFDIEKLARESDTPAQMMFLPSKRVTGEFWAEKHPGEWVDVDAVLGEYEDWTNRKEWPKRQHGDTTAAADDIVAPTEKPGIVGDFCRALTISQAIERFELPYRWLADNRWDYVHGSRPEGVIVYNDDTKLHSHHNTDPASGQNNAFDLVRLHKFGELDKPIDLTAPVTQRPSYKAMCQLAMDQPELQTARIQEEFDNLDEAPAQLEVTKPLKEDDSDERFHITPAPEFARDIALSWIVKNVLPRAELAVFFGESGSGKSFLVLDICAAIVRGEPWREKVTQKGRAVYVCAEGASGFKQRIRAYSQMYGVDLSELGIIADAPNLLEDKDVAAITHSIVQYERTHGAIDVVVIDTLSASMPGGDENTSKDMGKVLANCRFINRKTGAMVIMIHHSGKDASRGARGWSGVKGNIDAEVEITRNGDFRAARITKMKDGSDGDRMDFKLQTVVIGVDEDGDEITSCVVEHLATAPDVTPRRKPDGLYGKNALECAQKMCKGGDAVPMKLLVDTAVGRMPKPTDGRDTRRQTTNRAIQKLVVDGWLFLHDDNRISLTTALLEPEQEEDWLNG